MTAVVFRLHDVEDAVAQADWLLREHGIDDVSTVRMAVLEVDGSISVVPDDGKVLKSRRHYRGLRLP